MVTDVINHRESIGRFCPRALSGRKGYYLYSTLFVSLCFLNMVYLPFGLPLYYTSYFSSVLALIALQTMNLDPDMVDLLLLIMPALSLFYYVYCAYCYL